MFQAALTSLPLCLICLSWGILSVAQAGQLMLRAVPLHFHLLCTNRGCLHGRVASRLLLRSGSLIYLCSYWVLDGAW